MLYKRSSELFVEANKVIPGGVNSPVRAFKGVGGTPIFVKEAKGAYLYDVDGNKLIDYINSWGPMILGHAYEPVVNAVIEKAKKVAKMGGFFNLHLPLLEFVDVFERNLGADTDVLKKELYRFEDRGGDMVALRPEFTASVVRSLLENSFKIPARIFSFGALFRYDRPQKGRYRQFHQVNFESIGDGSLLEDVQIIILANNLLNEIGIEGSFELEINSLGSKQTLNNYKKILIEYFKVNASKLSALSLERLENNPIRILDSKEPEDAEICKNAPKISSVFTEDEMERFTKTLELLTIAGVKFKVNESIVRGLDYYTGVVFEFTTTKLGSQATILGGGRYDNLVEQMGGANLPAIGFAGGVERISLLLQNEIKPEKCLFLMPFKEEHIPFCLNLLQNLRKEGVAVQILEGGNVGKRLEKASKSPFESFALVIGDVEVSSNKFKVKNLMQSLEMEGDFEFLVSCLK